jgi:hypothetical protein
MSAIASASSTWRTTPDPLVAAAGREVAAAAVLDGEAGGARRGAGAGATTGTGAGAGRL